MEDDFLNELNHRSHITLTDRLCLDPLGKLVNRHQKVGLLILRPLERSNISSPQTANGQVIGIIYNS